MALRFDQLVSALARAVLDAQREVQRAQIGEIAEFFRDGSPVTVDLRIPRTNPSTGNIEAIEVRVPLIVLVNHNKMSIREMQVSMQLDLSELPNSDGVRDEPSNRESPHWSSPGSPSRVMVSTTTGKKPGEVGMAHITLRVAADDPPEGLARLLDHLQKGL
jgi:hypothetical protein